MSGDPVTKNDLEQVETKLERRFDGVDRRIDGLERRIDEVETRLERRIDEVETKLERRIDGVETKLDIVARQVAVLTGRVDTITATMVTRDDLASFREDVNRDIARHIKAGFEMMHRLFAAQDDRAKNIEDEHAELRHDFTEHTRDTVLHNRS